MHRINLLNGKAILQLFILFIKIKYLILFKKKKYRIIHFNIYQIKLNTFRDISNLSDFPIRKYLWLPWLMSRSFSHLVKGISKMFPEEKAMGAHRP